MAKERVADEKAVDSASIAMLEKGAAEGVSDAFGRADAQGPSCKFGLDGVCCRICHMGPCRITPKSPLGVCGADASTIAARNLLREVAAGTAAHSDHGRHLVELFYDVAHGINKDYQLKDEARLRATARDWGVVEEGREAIDIAKDLADVFEREFSIQRGKVRGLSLAPQMRQSVWAKIGLEPKGIDVSIVEALHRTHMGVDHDYKNLVHAALRTSLTDGWSGSMLASAVSDILFGTPSPVRAKANLGVLEHDMVNVLVHGHEPSLTEILVVASRDPEIIAAAKAVGATGVNLAGICCTANEVLMRHGVPVAGNFLQQELALITGAVELMITDVQCCMASLPDVAKKYHTKVVTTSPIAKNMAAEAVEFNDHHALECGKALLLKAVENFKNRDPEKVNIPDSKKPLVAGFSNEAIAQMLGGRFRKSFRPLNDAIISGRIRGVCGIVGCTNARSKVDDYIVALSKELLQRDIILLQTGCSAVACAKQGLLTPEAALEFAGPGLREICETVGIPPVLHMGSCVDNSRILIAATNVLNEGGLGSDLCELPAIGVAPEWMSEKAIAIAHYFVASGIDVVLGRPFYTMGSQELTDYLCNGLAEVVGARFHYISELDQAVETICAHIEKKREALGINKKAERKLLDMKDRRELTF